MINVNVDVPTKGDAYLIKVLARHLRRSAASKKAWTTIKEGKPAPKAASRSARSRA